MLWWGLTFGPLDHAFHLCFGIAGHEPVQGETIGAVCKAVVAQQHHSAVEEGGALVVQQRVGHQQASSLRKSL